MDSTAPQSSSAVLEDRPPYPQDIIAVIVSHVGDRETLLTLCLTNRVVGHEARIMIYRNLHVISHGHQSPEMHLKRLLESLTSNPDLPPLVQSFTMLDDITRSPQHTEETLNELIAMDTDPTSKRERVEQLLSILLSKVLPRMVNLQELAAYGSRIRASGLAPALLGVPSGPGDGGGSRAFFQLQKLVWDNCWDASFIDFIKTQTDLKVLSLGSSWCHWYSIVNYRIPQDICDGLTCILGDQRVIQAILPFAPGVRSAVLKFAVYRDERRFGPNVDMSAKGQLARAMSQLTMLSFHNFGCAELAHISILGTQALSSLRVLVVARLPETDVSPDMDAISQCPNLELFILLSWGVESGDMVSLCSFATRLMKPTMSLKEVVIYISSRPSNPSPDNPFWFLLRRGDSLPRTLDWPEKKRTRFLMPVDERDAYNPGWIDKGPLDVPPEVEKFLQW